MRPDNSRNLLKQIEDLHFASGKFAAICYREDIEMALRTPEFGGFQMLDLQDFPGQGTALVGLLDAFMESKGIIEPFEFSQFCNRVVPLALFDKYCWNNAYLSNDSGDTIAKQQWYTQLQNGKLNHIGEFEVSLKSVKKSTNLTLSISIEGTPYQNKYKIWVYPKRNILRKQNITICRKIDKQMFNLLKEGRKILLLPDSKEIEKVSVGGMFSPDYWNFSMFKSISESLNRTVSPGTLSILTDPSHPLFLDFPTESHSNWQWWSILKNSRPIILNNLKNYIPLVQVIDNIERNHKLGLIFEFQMGKGKLLICSCNLDNIMDKPEGSQLYNSILEYMDSPHFSPHVQISEPELFNLFNSEIKNTEIKGVKNITSYE